MANVKPIRTEADYDAAVARIGELMDAEVGTPEGEELDLLADLALLYESQHMDKEFPTPSILTEMLNIVVGYLNVKEMTLTEQSFFMKELTEIDLLSRRELLREYVCASVTILLYSVVDQIRSLDAILMVPNTRYTQLVLLRTTHEHLMRINYLTDETINANQRICRALRLYYTEMLEYEKLPKHFRALSSKLSESLQEAKDWFKEITSTDLKRVGAKELFDTGWGPNGKTAWTETATDSPLYETAYRFGSAVMHGNLLVTRNFDPPHSNINHHLGMVSGSATSIHSMQFFAAGALILSFASAVKLMDILPLEIMHNLTDKMTEIKDDADAGLRSPQKR